MPSASPPILAPLAALLLVTPALAQTWRWVPVEGDVYDMLWDPHRSVLYFGRENGSIGVYDPAANQFLPEFPNVGLQLRGMDITPEGHKLFVADRAWLGLGTTRYLRVVDLETGAVRSMSFTAILPSEGGSWDVAIGDDGWGFVTTEFNGTGDSAARRVSVEGEYIEFLPDWFPTGGILRIDGDSMTTASPDRSFVSVVTSSTFFYLFSYDTGNTQRIAFRDLAHGSVYDPSFSHDGRLLGAISQVSGPGDLTIYEAENLVPLRTFSYGGGFIFDAVRDRMYISDSWTSEVVVLDTNSWLEVYRLPPTMVYAATIWVNGQYEISADGRFLFVSRRDTFGTNTGFYVFDLNTLDCRPDLTTTAVPGQPGYGTPNGVVNSDDFFYFLAQYAQANLAVCDLTTGAIPAQPGYGVPNGILNSDDFFYFLALFGAGC